MKKSNRTRKPYKRNARHMAYNVYNEQGEYLLTVANAHTLVGVLVPHDLERFYKGEICRPDSKIIMAMQNLSGLVNLKSDTWLFDKGTKLKKCFIGWSFENGIKMKDMHIVSLDETTRSYPRITRASHEDINLIKEHLETYAPDLV